jgi:hypothetical protein
LTFAGVRPCLASAASTSSWSPPSTAVIPVGSAAAAAAMARPRTPVSRIASSAVSTPAMTPAPSSPTLCPAAASASTDPASGRAAATAIAAATSSGCATAVSLISSAPAVVPNLMRSQPASSEAAPRRSATPGNSSQGARKPGVCAPWPGAVMISILLPCPVEVCHLNVERYEVTR